MQGRIRLGIRPFYFAENVKIVCSIILLILYTFLLSYDKITYGFVVLCI